MTKHKMIDTHAAGVTTAVALMLTVSRPRGEQDYA